MDRFLLFIFILLFFLLMSANISALAGREKQIRWTRGADVPLPRGGYFAAWHDGGLWMAGGSYWKDGKKLWTDETSFYNPQTGKWTKLSPVPKAFGYGVTAKVGKDLYLLGGVDAEGNANKDIYRLRGENWSRIGESPAGFIYAAYAVVGSKVYVFGGSTSAADVTKATNETWIYDVKTGNWEKSVPFSGEPRQIFSAAAIGESIYIFGGVTQKPDEKIKNLDDAYRFDTKTKKWTAIKKIPVAMRAFWAAAVGKNIYLFGGYGEKGLDSIYRYESSKDEYKLVSKLPQPLMDTKFFYHKGIFYGAAGEDNLFSRFSGLIIGQVK